MADVLVILGAGSVAGDAAWEALRTGVGLAAGAHRVRLLTPVPPEAFRPPGAEYLLETFARLGGVLEPARVLPSALREAEVILAWGC
jgi:hypothetical protein